MKTILALCAAATCLGLFAGCKTTGTRRLGRPVDYNMTVHADGRWQYSKIRVRRHQIISCRAEGRWGYAGETYTADGDSRVIKEHHGVKAPSFALIMKLSGSTNYFYNIGTHADISAPIGGHLYFRSNISLPDGVSGKVDLDIRICSDADRDGVCDYEEVHIWGTDPFRADTDGDGFTDLEKIEYRRKIQRMKTDRSGFNFEQERGQHAEQETTTGIH